MPIDIELRRQAIGSTGRLLFVGSPGEVPPHAVVTRGRCPKCGAHKIRRSQRRAFDFVLIPFLTPYRCGHCSGRFYELSYVWTIYLIAVVMLVTWFVALHALYKGRAITATERAHPPTFSTEIL
jgi:hypothetical protein